MANWKRRVRGSSGQIGKVFKVKGVNWDSMGKDGEKGTYEELESLLDNAYRESKKAFDTQDIERFKKADVEIKRLKKEIEELEAKNIRRRMGWGKANSSWKETKMSREKLFEYIENVTGGKIYARSIGLVDKFDEKTFLNSKSYDEFVVESPKSLKDAQDLVEKYDLNGVAVRLKDEDITAFFGGEYGVRYEGFNALQRYDEMMMPHNTIVVFEGKYLGSNLLGDGDIVKPIRVVEVIHVID